MLIVHTVIRMIRKTYIHREYIIKGNLPIVFEFFAKQIFFYVCSPYYILFKQLYNILSIYAKLIITRKKYITIVY